MCPLLNHISWRVFCQNIKSSRWLRPCKAHIWCCMTSGFSKTKITFEKKEIPDHRWDSGKYDGAADGDSNKGFRVFWIVEEMLGELCEVPKCPLWRGLKCHCPVCHVSCIFYLLQWVSLFFKLHGWIFSGQALYIWGQYFNSIILSCLLTILQCLVKSHWYFNYSFEILFF